MGRGDENNLIPVLGCRTSSNRVSEGFDGRLEDKKVESTDEETRQVFLEGNSKTYLGGLTPWTRLATVGKDKGMPVSEGLANQKQERLTSSYQTVPVLEEEPQCLMRGMSEDRGRA